MANTAAYFGFRPVRTLHGPYIGQTNPYTIATGYSTEIHTNHPVKLVAGGTIEIAAAGDTAILGTFAGCKFKEADGTMKHEMYWSGAAGRTAIECYVVDDPGVIFEGMTDAASAFALADVGTNMDFAAGTSNDVTGVSGAYLNTATKGTTSDGNFRILRLTTRTGNGSEIGSYAVVECLINEHAFKGVVGI